MAYQQSWVQDKAGLKVCEKSRRVGLSWAESYDAVFHAAARKGGDVYYQSYAKDMTAGFIADCAEWASVMQIGAGAVGETVIDLGKDDKHPAYRLPLASGKQILAMTSAPRAFRSKGRPGDLGIIDEAAFVDDLDAVLKAAMAFRVWGGRVHVLSTHNGEGSPFDVLVRDVREGKRPGSLHRITLGDAVADGLYGTICAVTGERQAASEAEWVAAIRAEYADNAEEELDCVPLAAGSRWLPWSLIRAAEHEDAGQPALFRGGECYVGVDIARRRDLWVAVVVERLHGLLWVRELVARRNITFAEQHAIVASLVRQYRPVRVAIDQTGMGEEFVEFEQTTHGRHLVEGVLFTAGRRLDCASALKGELEENALRLPPDEPLRRDLHSVRQEAGPTGAPRLVADRSDGHADRFWALALACAAASTRERRYAYEPADGRRIPRQPRDRYDFDEDDAPRGWDAYAGPARIAGLP